MMLPFFASVVLALTFTDSALPTRGGAPRELFLDPSFIEKSKNVVLRLNPPIKSEIVIRPDKPWEKLMISFFLSVRDEAGTLRMWYICRDAKNQPNVAYAESKDGVHWQKPNLGIVEYEGSKDNNLVGMTNLEGVVIVDPMMKSADEKYLYVTHVFGEGVVRFHSPDGLRWNRDATPILKFVVDTQTATFWDHNLREYVLYTRGWIKGEGKNKFRKVVRLTTKDLRMPFAAGPSDASDYFWGKDKPPALGNEFPSVLQADERDPPEVDVYNLPAEPYPLDARWYVGFPSFFQRERTWKNGPLEVQFVGSRDGIVWHRYDRSAYVEPGFEGSDTAKMAFMGQGLVVRGDELWQFGTGFRSEHGDREARKKQTDGVILRHVQRIDGFVSADFAAAGGSCTTAPVHVWGDELFLNVDTGALGSLRVGLLDSNGKPIPGFSLEDCDIVRTNSVRSAVTWKGKSDVAALLKTDVRLHFEARRAKLFSFFFQ